MSELTAVSGDFTLQRVYPFPPARVFAAWTSAAAKAHWFVGPQGWAPVERTLDFRVGGRERVVGRFPSGTTSTFDNVYWDIVADRRLVYSYEMWIDDRKISVSLGTVELEPEGAGTRMTYTEQGVFLDGYDDAGSREHGSNILLDQLGAALARAAAN